MLFFDFFELSKTAKTIIRPIPIKTQEMIPNILLFFGVSTVTEVTFLGDEISSEVTSGKFKELVCSSLDVVSSEDADEDDCSVFCCTDCWLSNVWLVLDETAASCLEEEGGATEDGFDDGADD